MTTEKGELIYSTITIYLKKIITIAEYIMLLLFYAVMNSELHGSSPSKKKLHGSSGPSFIDI